jgi:hypothetical protein
MASWNKKQDQMICCLQKIHLTDKSKYWIRVKGWKKIFLANGPPKQAEVAIFISDKVDFKST